MRHSLFRLLIFLIAGCVGLQSTASAMGVGCAHGGSAAATQNIDGPHGQQASTSPPTMTAAAHAHHHASGQADASTDVSERPLDPLGCQCGCTCAHAGCMGTASGIAAAAAGASFGMAPDALRAPLISTRVLAAHALDLIRPPSIS